MSVSRFLGAIAMFATAAACSSTQTPPPAQPQIVVAAAAPAPAPEPPPAPAPSEARLENGHITLAHQILFDYDSDHIQEQQSQTVLRDLVALLQQNTQVRRLRVEGHTDVRGSAEHNMDLSRRRAAAVAEYLRGHGFPNLTFEPVGFGQTRPLCNESNDACHDRNRRVEFTITDPAPAATN